MSITDTGIVLGLYLAEWAGFLGSGVFWDLKMILGLVYQSGILVCIHLVTFNS